MKCIAIQPDNLDSLTFETVVIPCLKNSELEQQIRYYTEKWTLPTSWVSKDFKGDLKESSVFFSDSKKVIFLGLGENPKFIDIQTAFRSFFYQNKMKLGTASLIDISFNSTLQNILLEPAVNGILLSTYNIAIQKSTPPTLSPIQSDDAITYFWVAEMNGTDDLVQQTHHTAESQMGVYDLVNLPSNWVTPAQMAATAQQSADRYNYKVTVYDLEGCQTMGFKALLGVNQGSVEEPAMIVLEYTPENLSENSPVIGLVGKGVTFDTGGISLKDSTNMHYMKCDMAGAAAVMGAVELIAKLQLPLKVVAVIPATENSIDGESVKPGEIIGSYLGKTIEVIDTDAEGRLILADALSYIKQQFSPTHIIDLATLTGSCIRTFGYACAGIFSNDDTLCNELIYTGEVCGERLWRLPLWDYYADEIKSDIADVRNLSGKPSAGAISAAKFLEVFIDGHTSWAHLDIAGVAFNDSEFSSQRSATAYGVRLITDFCKKIAAKHSV